MEMDLAMAEKDPEATMRIAGKAFRPVVFCPPEIESEQPCRAMEPDALVPALQGPGIAGADIGVVLLCRLLRDRRWPGAWASRLPQ